MESVCLKCDSGGKNCANEVENFQSQNYELQQFLENKINFLFYNLQDEDKLNRSWKVSNSMDLMNIYSTLSSLPCRMQCN